MVVDKFMRKFKMFDNALKLFWTINMSVSCSVLAQFNVSVKKTCNNNVLFTASIYFTFSIYFCFI